MFPWQLPEISFSFSSNIYILFYFSFISIYENVLITSVLVKNNFALNKKFSKCKKQIDLNK